MGPFNFVDLCKTELLEIEMFDHLAEYLQNMFTDPIFDIYVKTGFGIK